MLSRSPFQIRWHPWPQTSAHTNCQRSVECAAFKRIFTFRPLVQSRPDINSPLHKHFGLCTRLDDVSSGGPAQRAPYKQGRKNKLYQLPVLPNSCFRGLCYLYMFTLFPPLVELCSLVGKLVYRSHCPQFSGSSDNYTIVQDVTC